MDDNVIPMERAAAPVDEETALRLENRLLKAYLDKCSPGWREALSEALESRVEAMERRL